MKEQNILFGKIKDKYHKSKSRGIVCATGFLDMKQRSDAQGFIQRERIQGIFYGGCEDSDRCRLYFLPEGEETLEELLSLASTNPEILDLKVIRLTRDKGGRELTHRDYLGSLMSLGITREKVGDIFVNEDGADIIVCAEIAEYILNNLSSAGRTKLEGKILSISDLRPVEANIELESTSVASLRLDGVLSQVFGIPRTSAQMAIKGGIVFVNDTEATKSDMKIQPETKLVIRGKGKAYLKEAKGKTRKGRTVISVEKYK